MQIQTSASSTHSVLFDPDLPTAKEMLSAICCVATQYAIKPSHELAVLAWELSQKLTAPEYADTNLIKEIARRLVGQWHGVVQEHQELEAQVLPQHNTLQ